MLIIAHPKTDERYAVSAADFRKVYEPQGFKAERYEDGSDYEPPAKKADKAADTAQDAPSATEGGQ